MAKRLAPGPPFTRSYCTWQRTGAWTTLLNVTAAGISAGAAAGHISRPNDRLTRGAPEVVELETIASRSGPPGLKCDTRNPT